MRIRPTTPAVEAALLWVKSWWPRRGRSLVQDYHAAMAEYPLVFADIARAACAFDSTIGPDRDLTLVNTGKREVWLHIAAMGKLDADRLRSLEQEPDNE